METNSVQCKNDVDAVDLSREFYRPVDGVPFFSCPAK